MPSIYIVGSINVDLVAYADRFPSPGETLLGTRFERHLGGKGANQAIAAARAGAPAVMVGAVGNGADDQGVRDALAAHGVDVREVETVADTTGVGLIVVAAGENQIVVVSGANRRIDPVRVGALDLQEGDVCLSQMETGVEVVRVAFERARSRGAVTVFNPAPALLEARPLFPLADVIVVNETECALYTQTEPNPAPTDEALQTAARAFGLGADQVLIVTLGAAGARAVVSGRIITIPGHKVEAIDPTAAGDCFCGYLAAALSRGGSIEDALREANAAAALSVQTRGAAPSIPGRERVREFVGA